MRFTAELGRSRLLDTYAASNVFVSMSTAEAARLTLIDAMAAGLPTIGARTPAVTPCVDGSRGMLVEAADTAAVVAAILALHRDPARAATLGASGRAYAARFAPGPIAAEWEEIYGEVLLRARPRRAAAVQPLHQPTARRS